MEKDAPFNKSLFLADASYTKSTQASNHHSVYVDMPEIVIENIKHSEESIMFYTELADFFNIPSCV